MMRRLPRPWMILVGWMVVALGAPVAAWAANCGCVTPTAATCCKAPTPPVASSQTCCGSGGNQIVVPGMNVYVAPTVIVNAESSAVVNASASASATTSSSTNAALLNNYAGGGGGGSSWYSSEGSTGLIQDLKVDSGLRTENTAYQASRTKVRTVVIEAQCLDDKDVPHPASQVTPDRELSDSYEGEVYRCIAGARMQVTVADYLGKIDFGHGETFTCAKNEAVVLTRTANHDANLQCHPQKPARDCNERSLLRRFGAGVKILKIVSTETYTAYREQQTRTAGAVSSFNMSIDGGVGGVAH